MKRKMSISIYDADTNDDYCLEIEADIMRDGIGAYEYWGAKCFDAGEYTIDNYTILAAIKNSEVIAIDAPELEDLNKKILEKASEEMEAHE